MSRRRRSSGRPWRLWVIPRDTCRARYTLSSLTYGTEEAAQRALARHFPTGRTLLGDRVEVGRFDA